MTRCRSSGQSCIKPSMLFLPVSRAGAPAPAAQAAHPSKGTAGQRFGDTKQNLTASSRGGLLARPLLGCQIGRIFPRGPERMRFTGTKDYVATQDLEVAVNAAIVLERPLLVKGEPGTGKTVLAEEIAKSVKAPLLTWHIKSTTKAQQGLYEYDAVSRLRDSQLGDRRVSDISNYIKRGKLWDAFAAEDRPVLLIDQVDKADIEFPNDLLLQLDRMEFHVYETVETVRAEKRPIVVITSNNEKELPDAFLRRCFFHYIRFPDHETMEKIIAVHFPGIKRRLVEETLRIFFEVRDVPGLKKKPSTSELLDWLKLLLNEDIGLETLRERDPKKLIPPLHGELLKK